MKKKKNQFFCLVFQDMVLSCKMWSVPHMQMRCGKSVMWPENDTSSELPLTSFGVTYPALVAVKADTFWQPTSHPNIRDWGVWGGGGGGRQIETQRQTDRQTDRLLKAFNLHNFCHTDLDLFMYSISKCLGFEQLHERYLFCIKNMLLIFLHICDPWAGHLKMLPNSVWLHKQ